MFVPRSYIYASPLCACILSRVAFLEMFPCLLSETNDWQFFIFLSSCRLKFQTNPTLKYLYPPPSSGILTNIVHTLLSVPKFYVQVSRGYKDFFLIFFCCFIYQFMLGIRRLTSCVSVSVFYFQVFSSYQVKKTPKQNRKTFILSSLRLALMWFFPNQVQSLKHQTTIFAWNYSDGINIALMWEGWVMYLTFSLKLHRTKETL